MTSCAFLVTRSGRFADPKCPFIKFSLISSIVCCCVSFFSVRFYFTYKSNLPNQFKLPKIIIVITLRKHTQYLFENSWRTDIDHTPPHHWIHCTLTMEKMVFGGRWCKRWLKWIYVKSCSLPNISAIFGETGNIFRCMMMKAV